MIEEKFAAVGAFEGKPNWDRFVKRKNRLYGRKDDIRSPFQRDYTRILHCLAYRRLKHKTQVFFNAAGNDHICTRMEHVQHVESVSYTIAKTLGLNTELTMAIALAHDLGHAPFGHQGEKILSELCEEHGLGKFWHEKNGLYIADSLELLEDDTRKFKNLNLTYAVRDGIISHCGELNENALKPRGGFFDLSEFDSVGKYQASSWEGLAVKLSDKIAYLGRDIEDANRLGILSESDMDQLKQIARVNKENVINTTVIMHGMIIDLCKNSSPESGLCLSEPMSRQLSDIKDFDYKHTYLNDRIQPFNNYSRLVLRELFAKLMSFYDDKGLTDIMAHAIERNYDDLSYVKSFFEWLLNYVELDEIDMKKKVFMDKKDDFARLRQILDNTKTYKKVEKKEYYIRAVIDFLAGMTDKYAVGAFNQLIEIKQA